MDTGKAEYVRQLAKYCSVPAELELKQYAQVMLLHNIDVEIGLCNGARGVVIGFDPAMGDLPRVQFSNGVCLSDLRFSELSKP